MIFTDQIRHTFELKSSPLRIISVVPSQTELLYDLGLDEQVVGITKFCVHPKEWFRNKDKIGGTKSLSLDKIAELKPDLIIANKEENTQSEIEELQRLYPVYTSDISNLKESLKMIRDIGVITNSDEKADTISKKIQFEFDKLSKQRINNKRALYFIWQNPYMTINQSRFINDMMQRCGLVNVIKGSVDYPEISEKEMVELNPQLIFLSSEPFPFKEKHVEVFQNSCPKAKIMLVDGEYFSWYGSRLLRAPNYFIGLIEKMA